MKRVATIQDISCIGKCSLTVALPIISAMGVECAIMPTAVLSTHTAFKGFTFHDITNEMVPIKEHWKKEDFKFDALYTGYLGSIEQIEIVKEIFDDFKTDDNVIVVDPAMADNGNLYPGFDADFPKQMLTVCAKADYVLPNITEASLMLGKEYIEKGYDRAYIEDMLQELHKAGAKIPAITGVSFEKGKLGVMAYDSEKDEYIEYYTDEIDAKYHGTGDIFASCFTGALMNGFDLQGALKLAADYTARSIQNTEDDENGIWYGVNFEAEMPYLVNAIK